MGKSVQTGLRIFLSLATLAEASLYVRSHVVQVISTHNQDANPRDSAGQLTLQIGTGSEGRNSPSTVPMEGDLAILRF